MECGTCDILDLIQKQLLLIRLHELDSDSIGLVNLLKCISEERISFYDTAIMFSFY